MMEPLWDWKRNDRCIQFSLAASIVTDSTVFKMCVDGGFLMDDRLSAQNHRFLLDPESKRCAMISRWGLVAGDGLMDVIYMMDTSRVTGLGGPGARFHVEYRFAGEFYTRLEIGAEGSDPLRWWRTLWHTHTMITTQITDRVAPRGSPGTFVHMTPSPAPISSGARAGMFIGWTR